MKYILLSMLFVLTSTTLFAQERHKAFVENGKYGLQNEAGELLLEPVYDYICDYTSYGGDKVLVRIADSCFLMGVKTKTGSLLYNQPRGHKQKLTPAKISVGDKYGYIDSVGCVIIEGQWDFADNFYDGIARVVNYEGQPFADYMFTRPTPGKTGFIDTAGNYLIPMEYSYIDRFANGVARFTRGKYVCAEEFGCENPYVGSKWGLMDKSGKIVLPDDKYDFIDAAAFDRKNNRIVFGVIVGNKKGYIDTAGNAITPLYDSESFQAVWKLHFAE